MADPGGHPLDRLYRATSVAVIGAVPAGEHGRLGSKPVEYLRRYGFPGPVYPVNPNHREIAGFPCYPGITDVPGPVDTALLMRRRGQVLDTLRDCLAAGVRTAVVTAGGYAESGADGAEAQRLLGEFARDTGLRVAGPNCNGFISVRERLTVGFHPILEAGPPLPGPVGIVAQSGSFISSVMRRLARAGVGVSYALSCGNEVDITAAENLEFLVDDPATAVVVLFLESARAPARFRRAAELARDRGTRLVALKVGRTARGAHASASHTGALVGSDADYRALFERTGIIGVDTAEELVACVCALVAGVRPAGPRLGVISASGGVNALVADRVARHGLELPELGPALTDEVRALLPISSPMNPLDLTGVGVDDPDTLGKLLHRLDAHDGFDALLLVWGLLPDEAAARWTRTVLAARAAARLPTTVYAVAGELPHAVELRGAGVPVFTELDAALAALRAVAEPAPGPGRDAPTSGPRVLDPTGSGAPDPSGPPDIEATLAALGVRFVARASAAGPDEAVREAARLGYPVVVKVRSPDIPHRSAVGAVRLGVADEAALRIAVTDVLDTARSRVPHAHLDGVDLQPMVTEQSFELLVGITAGIFGPVVAVAAGGTLAEVLDDAAVALCPVSPAAAAGLLRRLRCWPLLERGLPGTGPLDVPAACAVVAAVSEAALDLAGRLRELDLNPVLVHRAGRGVTVVDVLARWAEEQENETDVDAADR